MPTSVQQLANINARLAELTPSLCCSSTEDVSDLPARFDEVTGLLRQARALTGSSRVLSGNDEGTREILAEYRRHLVAVRDAIGRMEPLLTARRAELHRQLEHIRHASCWASSVREVR